MLYEILCVFHSVHFNGHFLLAGCVFRQCEFIYSVELVCFLSLFYWILFHFMVRDTFVVVVDVLPYLCMSSPSVYIAF